MASPPDPHRVWLNMLGKQTPTPPAQRPSAYAAKLKPVMSLRAPLVNLAPPAAAGPPPAALTALRAAGRMSLFLLPAALLAATVVVNEPGIAQASINWGNGMSMALDDGVKMTMPLIIAESKKAWVAYDQEAFEEAVARLSVEIGKLRDSFKQISGVLDEVRAVVWAFWAELSLMAITLLRKLVLIQMGKALPHTRPLAYLQEVMVGKLAYGAVTLMLGQVVGIMARAGHLIGVQVKKWHQIHYVTPGGKLQIDPSKAKIDTTNLPSYHKADKPDQLPPDSQNFKWRVPK